MQELRGRTLLTSMDLEQLSRCPHSVNYLDRIGRSRSCKRCSAFAQSGRFVLQRNFKGGNLPSLHGIVKYYGNILGVQDVPSKDQMMLNDLLHWGKGIADDINVVDVMAETHMGLYTIRDTIDAVIYDIDTFTIIQFICDIPHQERIMNYRALHASHWLRTNYDIEHNGVIIAKMSTEGIQIHRFLLDVPENILRSSIEYILSRVERGESGTDLPAIYGEHCWHCMACFPGGNEDVDKARD